MITEKVPAKARIGNSRNVSAPQVAYLSLLPSIAIGFNGIKKFR